MRLFALSAILAFLPAAAMAQTVGARAIAQDVFTDRPAPGEAARGVILTPPARTVVQERVVTERAVPATAVVERPVVRERVAIPATTVVERPVVRERVAVPATTVVERPVVRERVVVNPPAARWWDTFARNRYGYYEDAYFDDNWFYDYYEVLRTERGAATPGFRTGWIYDPIAERGLSSF